MNGRTPNATPGEKDRSAEEDTQGPLVPEASNSPSVTTATGTRLVQEGGACNKTMGAYTIGGTCGEGIREPPLPETAAEDEKRAARQVEPGQVARVRDKTSVYIFAMMNSITGAQRAGGQITGETMRKLPPAAKDLA